jgi:hypothetical protein
MQKATGVFVANFPFENANNSIRDSVSFQFAPILEAII